LQLVAGQRQPLAPRRGQSRETPPEIVATLIAILTKALKAPEMEAAYGGSSEAKTQFSIACDARLLFLISECPIGECPIEEWRCGRPRPRDQAVIARPH